MAWTGDWAPGEVVYPDLGTQVEAIHLCDWKEWTPPSQKSFKGWQPQGKHLYLEITFFGVFSEPWFLEGGEHSFIIARVWLLSFLGLKQLYLLLLMSITWKLQILKIPLLLYFLQ